jgi:hypothetical protein
MMLLNIVLARLRDKEKLRVEKKLGASTDPIDRWFEAGGYSTLDGFPLDPDLWEKITIRDLHWLSAEYNRCLLFYHDVILIMLAIWVLGVIVAGVWAMTRKRATARPKSVP